MGENINWIDKIFKSVGDEDEIEIPCRYCETMTTSEDGFCSDECEEAAEFDSECLMCHEEIISYDELDDFCSRRCEQEFTFEFEEYD
jgi:endogenous inhibitor of DNA gyrase (YacG/DUF329 family)